MNRLTLNAQIKIGFLCLLFFVSYKPEAIAYFDKNSSFKKETEKIACEQTYKEYFNSNNGEINFSIHLGYIDSSRSDTLYNEEISHIILELFTRSCSSETEKVCGFYESIKSRNYYKLERIMVIQNKFKKVNIELYTPEFSNSNQENKESLDQKILSKKSWDQFLNSLQSENHGTFYIGHSRYGTGPDFGPQNTIESLLQIRKLKLEFLSQINPRKKPKVVGFISCDSNSYYGNLLQNKFPTSGLLLTSISTPIKDLASIAIASIDSLLNQDCEKEFNQKLKSQISRLLVDTQLVGNVNESKNYNSIRQLKERLYPKIYNFFILNEKRPVSPRTHKMIPQFEYFNEAEVLVPAKISDTAYQFPLKLEP